MVNVVAGCLDNNQSGYDCLGNGFTVGWDRTLERYLLKIACVPQPNVHNNHPFHHFMPNDSPLKACFTLKICHFVFSMLPSLPSHSPLSFRRGTTNSNFALIFCILFSPNSYPALSLSGLI